VARALVHHSKEPLPQRSSEQGAVQFQKLPVGQQLLQVQAKGYSFSMLGFNMAQGIQAGARLTLLPLEGPYSFDSTKEYSVDVGSLSITIPPGALSDSQGQPVEEVVDLFVGRPDLENDALVEAPNLLEGVARPGADPVGLETLGMVALVFQRKDGQLLSFARGPKIRDDGTRGNFGLPGGRPESSRQGATLASTLPPLPVWRVDPESGYWVPTGDMGTIVESGTEPGRYKWEVTLKSAPHLFAVALPFWWRSPAASREEPLRPPEPAWVETSCLDVRVEDAAGQPVAGRLVVARGVDYVSMTRALTDADGRARLEVMRGKKVKVEAGGEPWVVDAGSEPGNCRGRGAQPVPVTLEVPVRTCTPGAERECAYGGPKGTSGVGACRAGRQVCDANGTGWSDTCEGEVRPQQEESCDTVRDDNCDGAVNEGCASICREGDTRPCYEGPEGTTGMGQCHAGTQTCMAGGTAWSACEGQLLPEAEDCSRPGDEDCDGVACRCLPEERQWCSYSGPEGTEGVGTCRASTRACNASGTDWSACTSEVLPLPEEDCTTTGDDDCDG
ncbi:MAG TPA: carboxypeptidase-like regulatory domain-containing protein, partial [Cystobacter sp.]